MAYLSRVKQNRLVLLFCLVSTYTASTLNGSVAKTTTHTKHLPGNTTVNISANTTHHKVPSHKNKDTQDVSFNKTNNSSNSSPTNEHTPYTFVRSLRTSDAFQPVQSGLSVINAFLNAPELPTTNSNQQDKNTNSGPIKTNDSNSYASIVNNSSPTETKAETAYSVEQPFGAPGKPLLHPSNKRSGHTVFHWDYHETDQDLFGDRNNQVGL